MKRISSVILVMLLTCSLFSFGQENDKDRTIVCPGRGERCAYIVILGIKIWSKKDKGSPGIIIKRTLASEN